MELTKCYNIRVFAKGTKLLHHFRIEEVYGFYNFIAGLPPFFFLEKENVGSMVLLTPFYKSTRVWRNCFPVAESKTLCWLEFSVDGMERNFIVHSHVYYKLYHIFMWYICSIFKFEFLRTCFDPKSNYFFFSNNTLNLITC